jgi:hypothetical protein
LSPQTQSEMNATAVTNGTNPLPLNACTLGKCLTVDREIPKRFPILFDQQPAKRSRIDDLPLLLIQGREAVEGDIKRPNASGMPLGQSD